MKLHYDTLGQGEPLIILHGLFGSSANWRSIAQRLADRWQVILPDLRNHGDSPHASTHRYMDLAGDTLALMDRLDIETAHLLGHSLGGKTAMLIASRAAERVRSLTVVDIAPRAYAPLHLELFDAMQSLPLGSLASRREASESLGMKIPNPAVRDFLLTNLMRDADGRFHWRINLPALEQAYDELNDMPFLDRLYQGPALFIRGGHSDYVRDADLGLIHQGFPKACVVSLPFAHHWPHVETPDAFLQALRDFLTAHTERLPCAEGLSREAGYVQEWA
ncbi:MAG: alpha/beta fold hydrolase [Halothiobacillaceae bacterium]|nr:MAG: alpha/beta fold hydrolase [Halothiobacillaceae bacterium]